MSEIKFDESAFEALRQGAAVWNAWKQENPEVRPFLADAQLSGADLSNCDLRRTYLGGANLTGANLSRANLYNVRLDKSNLRDAVLVEARLNQTWLNFAVLAGANLSQADLTEARMRAVDLSGANLSRACLVRTELSGADLGGADLTRGYIHVTDLRGASLRGANLTEATLDKVSLDGAVFQGANLGRAELANTVFRAIDLSEVQGMESVVHRGPSTIGVETLLLSQGRIPPAFLQGCGIPKELIAATASLSPQPAEYYPCFIHYRTEDREFALQLHNLLQNRGIPCWLEEESVPHDFDYVDAYGPLSQQWEKVLLCASRNSINYQGASWVLGVGLEKERARLKAGGKQEALLLVLDLDGFLWEECEPFYADEVKSHVVASFKGWETDPQKIQDGLNAVLKALRTAGGREEPPKSLL